MKGKRYSHYTKEIALSTKVVKIKTSKIENYSFPFLRFIQLVFWLVGNFEHIQDV